MVTRCVVCGGSVTAREAKARVEAVEAETRAEAVAKHEVSSDAEKRAGAAEAAAEKAKRALSDAPSSPLK